MPCILFWVHPNISHMSTCHMLHVTCYMSHVTCHMSHDAFHMSHVACHMSYITCPWKCHACMHAFMSAFILCHISTCQMSHVTRHMSHVTCNMPHVTCHISHVLGHVMHCSESEFRVIGQIKWPYIGLPDSPKGQRSKNDPARCQGLTLKTKTNYEFLYIKKSGTTLKSLGNRGCDIWQ